jgi:hypothetical protein
MSGTEPSPDAPLSIALLVLFAAAVLLPVALGLMLGWEYRLSFSTGALARLCWIAFIAVVTVQSAIPIAQYRSDRHA